MIEEFQLREWRHCLGKLYRCSEITSGSWLVLITQAVHVYPCSKSAMKGNNGTNNCTTILLPNHNRTSPYVYLLEPGIPDCRLPWVSSKRKLFLMDVGNSVKDDSSRVSSCVMFRFYGRDTIVYASEHYFVNQRFRNCNSTVDVDL
jgi:hypothetical protein